MKVLALATALIAAVAVAVPAEAATGKKKKKVTAVQAPQSSPYSNLKRVPPHLQHPYGVYGADGELLGMDPDPNIRMMIRKDPKPWDNNS
jgi:hypothetical protein